MKRQQDFQKSPAKRLKKMKLTILSKYAKSIKEATEVPDVLARLIGQFLGTDMPYNPGDTFIRSPVWGRSGNIGAERRVPLVQSQVGTGRGYIRWFYGQQFNVYKVLRVTPCQLTIKLQKEYHAYQRWTEEHRGPFDVEDLDTLFVSRHGFWSSMLEVFNVRFKKSDQHDLELFKRLKLDTAVHFRSEFHTLYDADQEKLVLTDQEKLVFT